MLISSGLGWVSSRVSINESILGGPKPAGSLTCINIYKPQFTVIFKQKRMQRARNHDFISGK